MDTNPFATNNPATQQTPQTSPYLQQQPNNGTVAGGVSNMIKALMQGNQNYQQRQQGMQGAQGNQPMQSNPTTTTGGPSVGQPMSLSPPTDPSAMTGGLGQTPGLPGGAGPAAPLSPMTQSLFPNPAGGGASMTPGMTPPMGMDPVTQALMSPIPGVSGG